MTSLRDRAVKVPSRGEGVSELIALYTGVSRNFFYVDWLERTQGEPASLCQRGEYDVGSGHRKAQDDIKSILGVRVNAYRRGVWVPF